MALTEPEAKVLGALSHLDTAQALTVRQICGTTGLTDRTARAALSRLARSGLALSTKQTPANWRPTERGLLAVRTPPYRDYAGAGSR